MEASVTASAVLTGQKNLLMVHIMALNKGAREKKRCEGTSEAAV